MQLCEEFIESRMMYLIRALFKSIESIEHDTGLFVKILNVLLFVLLGNFLECFEFFYNIIFVYIITACIA